MSAYIEWDSEAAGFRPANSNLAPPSHPSDCSWWTSTAATRGDHAATQVTHLGDRRSAEFRAQAQANWKAPPTGLFEVELPADLAVLGEIYLENHGNDAMHAFERKLLGSRADAAYYWNKKEAEQGAWSLVVRRDFLGELPRSPGPRVRLLSQFSASSISRLPDAPLTEIDWTSHNGEGSL